MEVDTVVLLEEDDSREDSLESVEELLLEFKLLRCRGGLFSIPRQTYDLKDVF